MINRQSLLENDEKKEGFKTTTGNFSGAMAMAMPDIVARAIPTYGAVTVSVIVAGAGAVAGKMVIAIYIAMAGARTITAYRSAITSYEARDGAEG